MTLPWSSLRRAMPPLAPVRLSLPSEHIADPRRDVCEKLLAAGLQAAISPGAQIAITAGSRGIGGGVELLAGIAAAVRKCGGEPIIIPAMGSHGGATADGQSEVLRRLNVREENVGAPIRATMDTVALGRVPNGALACLDSVAAAADGIIVLGRVKTHPESDEGLASGLLKMITIGLGKQRGAQEAHSHGLWESVRQVSERTIAQSKILFGVAVVENGYRQPLVVEVVPTRYEAFLEADERLLKIAKPHVAKLPVSRLDLLVVDQIGKTISGSGMDLNVIGKYRATGEGPRIPAIKRIVALSLTPASLGNGIGIGLADFTTKRLLRDYDPVVTYINVVTASERDNTTREGPMPLALDSDREAIEVGMYSALPDGPPRVCRIRSTAELDRMWLSPALVSEVAGDTSLTVEAPARELPFNGDGNLF